MKEMMKSMMMPSVAEAGPSTVIGDPAVMNHHKRQRHLDDADKAMAKVLL